MPYRSATCIRVIDINLPRWINLRCTQVIFGCHSFRISSLSTHGNRFRLENPFSTENDRSRCNGKAKLVTNHLPSLQSLKPYLTPFSPPLNRKKTINFPPKLCYYGYRFRFIFFAVTNTINLCFPTPYHPNASTIISFLILTPHLQPFPFCGPLIRSI